MYNNYVQMHAIYGNHLANDRATRIISKRKITIMEGIYDKGIFYEVNADNDFTLFNATNH